MKLFELTYLSLEPFLIPLHQKVRTQLLKMTKSFPYRPEILDVGGRKSHYTIGIPGNITIIDLPKETEIQQRLNLGVNQKIVDHTYARRSNVHKILLEDMTRSSLPDQSFDCVVAVEVLEHVEEDALFLQEVRRVLKPGGVFLMTTPNGDFIPKPHPDHKRHYTRERLRSLLSSVFANVEVEYAICGGIYRRIGLRSWSINHPQRTVLSMVGNFVNSIQSAGQTIKHQAQGTHHLIAVAEKRN